MLPWSIDFAGRLDELQFESEALKGNALRDPHIRPLWVYVPPGYDDEPERGYPSIYLIQGLGGQLDMWRNRGTFRRNPVELMDGLFASGDAEPAREVDRPRQHRARKVPTDPSRAAGERLSAA